MTDDQARPIEQPAPGEAAPAPVNGPGPEPVNEAAPEPVADLGHPSVSAPSEPAIAPAEAAPPPPTLAAAAPPRSNRGRWLLALGVAGLAILLTAGALLVLNGPTTPEALRYVPADAAFVGEIRMDLPGDQMQHLGNLLAHFPGFKDQATLTDKIDEGLTRLVATASDGKADFRADLKPWLNGPVFIGLIAPPSGTATDAQAVISATTNGGATCAAAFKGQAVTHDSYRGLDLVLSANATSSGPAQACVLDGRQALLGDPATVRKALDAKAAGNGIDKAQAYRDARTSLGADRLATLFVSGSAVARLIPVPGASAAIPDLSGLVGSIPAWTMVGLRAEDDALVVDTVMAPVVAPSAGPSLLPLPATHASEISGLLPADTTVFVESQGAGVALQNVLATLRANPELAAPLQVLDGLGGGGDLVGWIDDVGLAASVHGTTPDVTLLVVARDAAAASSRVSALSLIGLAGLGDRIEVRPTTINGVAVTTLRIADLGALIPAGTVPGLDSIPVTGAVELSVAARGRVIVVTSGEAAMTALLNVQPGAALADQAPFKAALKRGLANSRTTVYLAAGAGFDQLKGLLPAETLAKWDSDIAPYVDPIEAAAISISGDPAAPRSRIVITVSQP